jgi:hypothetical protein
LLVAAQLVAPDGHAAVSSRTLFKFSAGSGLFARPGLGQGGALYIGSGDGYVHALAADGGFRWSVAVKGRVLAPPVEEAGSGRVFVATSESRLYALESDSHLRWVFPLPAAPKTELVLTPRGTLFFVGQDDHLYSVTTGGALSLRLAAAGARSAPALLDGGQPGLVLGERLATLKGYGYDRAPLSAAFAASAKLALDENRVIFSCEEGVARVVGRRETELSAPSDCLSPPVRGDGFFAIAEGSGAVRLLFADGTSQSFPLGSAPLRPTWDGARRRLILATAMGAVSVLELTGAAH